MHVLDSADSVGGLYVIGPPATLIGRHYLNAIGLEILGVLSAAGLSPRASGPADAVANYTGQLRDSIRRLSANLTLGTHEMIASPETLTPDFDKHAYHILESTNLPDGELTIDTDSTYENRVLLVYNKTISTKILKNVDGSTICNLYPEQAVSLFGVDFSGDIYWMALGRIRTTDELDEGANLYWTDTRFDDRLAAKSTGDLIEGSRLYYTDSRADARVALGLASAFAWQSLNLQIYDEDNVSLQGSTACQYKVYDGLVHLTLPVIDVTLGGSAESIKIMGVSGAELPAAIQVDADKVETWVSPAVTVIVGGTAGIGGTFEKGHLRPGSLDGYFTLCRANGSYIWPTGTEIYVPQQTISYQAFP